MPFELHSKPALPIDRRGFIRIFGLGGAAFFAFDTEALLAADYDPSSASLMEFDVTYRTEIMNLPKDAEDVHIWMPVPVSDRAQTITNFVVDSPLPYEYTREKTFGNRILHLETGYHARPFALESRYHVTRRRVGTEETTLEDAQRSKYLQLTRRVRVTEAVEAFAREIIGDATDPYEVGRRVFHGIGENLVYDKSLPGCGMGDTAWILKYRRGKCDDYHALFMAIMVSRDIPVRWEQGFPLPFPEEGKASSGELEGDCSGSHCWASFYVPERGWVPVDVSEGDKAGSKGEFFFGHLSPNRFQVSEGRAIVLEPSQGGDPLRSFAFAYAEADGIPLIYQANYENRINYEITRIEST